MKAKRVFFYKKSTNGIVKEQKNKKLAKFFPWPIREK
jgi:hypothetical protein